MFIRAIVKLQSCTTKPGRRAFVSKNYHTHGIAAGNVRYYQVIAASWPGVRRAIASVDSTGKRTMGFSMAGPDTVESFGYIQDRQRSKTSTEVRALSIGWKPGTRVDETSALPEVL